MDNDKKTERRSLPTLFSKRWVQVCCSTLILFALFLFLLPHAVQIGLERWLIKNGADLATIQKIELNLFTGAASLQGVNVVLDDKTVLANSDISLNLGLGALFKRHTLIQSASLNKIVLDIEQYEDGRWRFGSFTTQKQEKVGDLPGKTSTPWLFQAHQLELVDCTVYYTQPDLRVSLYIEQGELHQFSTGPAEMPAELTLKGLLNNAPFSIQLNTLTLAPTLTVGGTLKTSGILLDGLADLLQQHVNPFSGVSATDGKFNFALSEDGGILVDYNGSIELDQGDIGGEIYSFKGKNTSWDGQVKYQQDKQHAFHIDLDGTLAGDEISVDLHDQQLRLQEKMLSLAGKTSITIADEIIVNTEAAITSEAFLLNMHPYLLSDQGKNWQGTVQYRTGPAPINHHVSAAGKFLWQNPSITIDDGSLSLSLKNSSLSWNGQFEYKNDQSIQGQAVQTSGKLNIDGTRVDNTSFSAAGEGIRWQGTTAYTGGNKPAAVNLNGSLTGSKLFTELKDRELQATLDSVDVTTQSSLVVAKPLSFIGNAAISTAGLLINKTASDVKVVSFDRFSITGIQAVDDSLITVNTIALEQLKLTEPNQQIFQAEIPEIVFTNTSIKDRTSLTTKNVTIQETVLTSPPGHKKVLEVEELEMNKIVAERTGAVTVDQAQLANLIIMAGDNESGADSFLQADSIILDSPGWTADKILHSKSIVSNDLRVNVIRDTDGQLLINKELQKITGQEKSTTKSVEKDDKEVPPASNQAVEAKTGPGFRVNTIEVAGDSAIRFTDKSMNFPFSTTFSPSIFKIQGIDSSQPDKPATYTIEGKLDQYAQLSLNGELNPFTEKTFLTMNRTLKNYPLINLGPYSKEYLGIVPSKGTLYTDSVLKIDQGNLDLEETLLLKKLEIKTVNDELSSQLDSQLPLPLNAALSMLRDKDDNISLPVSMSGPVDDLDFGISGIFITPLSKAIVTGASTYLTYALGPYGALAYVGMKVGEKMMQTNLPAVEFEPASPVLTEEHHKYLDRIADLLKNRPKIDIQLCAQVTRSDLILPDAAKQEKAPPTEFSQDEKNALVKLGHSRALAIKDYLSQSHTIDPGRILICLPELDQNDKAIPRVELQL